MLCLRLINHEAPDRNVVGKAMPMKAVSMDINNNYNTPSRSFFIQKPLKDFEAHQLISENVKADKQKLKFYTGFIHPDLFNICFEFITDGQLVDEIESKLPLIEQFLLVLVKLRLCLTDQHLFNK